MADTPSLTDERITAIFRKVFNLIDSRPVGKQLEFVRAIESEVRASVVPQVDAVMEQAQVFASAWSLVGGLFDSGDGLAHAEQMRADLRTMVEALAAAPQCPQPQAEPSPEVERMRALLTECRATLEMWKDVAPAFSLCKDIDAALSGGAQ
jgi:hypothetical protein